MYNEQNLPFDIIYKNIFFFASFFFLFLDS